MVAGSHPGISGFNINTLEKLWIFEVEEALFYTPPYYADRQQSIESSPIISGDNIFFGAMDGCFNLLDLETGELQWKKRTGAPILSTAITEGNKVYVADFAGNVYCFE